MIINSIISIVFLLLLGLVLIRGRYAKAGMGEAPLIYKSVVVQSFLDVSLIVFLVLVVSVLVYNWKLFILLLGIGLLTGALFVVPIIERVLAFVVEKIIPSKT